MRLGTESSSAEKKLQNTPVQRLKSDNPTTGLASGSLVTRPRELSITLQQQCKDKRIADLTNYGKKI
jgi:hypothetical protein